MNPDTSKIRQFLRDRFDDEELTAFCFDHFNEVYQNFTEGMTKKRKIQLLLEHCQRQDKLPHLLSALKQARPELYNLELGEIINTQTTAVPPQQTIPSQPQQPQQEQTPSLLEAWLTAVKQAPLKMMGVPVGVILFIILVSWGISQLKNGEEIAETPVVTPNPTTWRGSPILVEVDHFQGEIQLDEPAMGNLQASESDTWLFVANAPIIVDILLEGIEVESGYIRLFKESDDIDNPYKDGQAIALREIAKITNVSLDVGRYMIAVQDALGDGRYTLTIQKQGTETAVLPPPTKTIVPEYTNLEEIIVPTSLSSSTLSSTEQIPEALIVFSYSGEIYVVNTTNTELVNLTNSNAYDEYPIWSPDGKQIAFTTDRDGNKEIYVMNADGSNLINLTDNSARDEAPAWSPDGAKIAFHSDREGLAPSAAIFMMNADGSNPVRLSGLKGFRPDWSPDGNYIAYRSFDAPSFHIISIDGSTDMSVVKNSQGGDGFVWSPDGNQFAIRMNLDGKDDIYIVNTATFEVTRLTNDSTTEGFSIAWSPDSSKIAYTTFSDDQTNIYMMNVDGTEKTKMTNGSGKYANILWFPNGEWLAFLKGEDGSLDGDIYVMKVDNSRLVRLTNLEDIRLFNDSYKIHVAP